MNKGIFLLLGVVFGIIIISNSVLAFNLEVSSNKILESVIAEQGGNGSYELVINNLEQTQQARIYSLVGFEIKPDSFFVLNEGASRMNITVVPSELLLDRRGTYNFEYQIKGEKSGIYRGFLVMKIVSVGDALNISSKNVNPGDNKMEIVLNNKVDSAISGASLKLSSIFFDDKTVQLDLNGSGEQTIVLDLNVDKVRTLKTGEYGINAEVVLNGKESRASGKINYIEKEGVIYSEKSFGLIVRKTELSKTNEGNVEAVASIILKKDVFTRLFTSFSIEPKQTVRTGFFVRYVWDKDLQPGESLVIVATTNYSLPLIILVLVVIIIFMAKIYSMSDLAVSKKVSYVRTKGGEFALKITLHAKARRYIDKIQIIDKLPGMTRIYEKYGRRPDRIDSATRRLFWDIDHLNAGEERVFSYIIYSKVRAIGSFELPAATALYEREGLARESRSNKTFFVSEAGNIE